MQQLFERRDLLVKLASMKFVRDIMYEINWDAQLICIRGARGVGKTTLMLQYIKSHYKSMSREVLFVSLDMVYFATHSLVELAETFYKNGGRHLFVDEVHKYPNWSQEVKEIYDFFPDMRVVISGSSLLNILGGNADLSRRCVPYDMQGLSFREFLKLHHDIDIRKRPLEEILNTPEDLCAEVMEKCQPLPLFKDYLRFGYFPFYLKNKNYYYALVEQIVNYVIESELPQFFHVEAAMTRKIKALMGIISSTLPFQVDATKLSGVIGVHRTTVINLLYMLDKASLIKMIFEESKTIKKLQKPDKLYIENTNTLHAISSHSVDIGTVRETFCVNQLSHNHEVEYSKQKGDFLIDRKYTVEVGGRNKGFTQISGVENSFILADDIESPFGRKLPLWTMGFLY